MKRQTQKANIFILAVILMPIILGIFIGIVEGMGITVPLWLLLMAGELSILIGILLYMLLVKGNIKSCLPLRKMKMSTVLWCCLLTICIMPGVTVINLLTQFFTENAVTSVMLQVYELPFWFLFFVMAIMPPIIEEVAFRGILLQNYRRNGVLMAILLSAFLFGLMHGNLNQMCYATAIGVIIAFVVEATGNILAGSLMHFIINGSNLLLLKVISLLSGMSLVELYQQELEEMELVSNEVMLISSLSVYIPLAIIGGVAAYFVFRQLCRSTGRLGYVQAIVKNRIVLPEKERTIDVWLIFAIVIGLLLVVIAELV